MSLAANVRTLAGRCVGTFRRSSQARSRFGWDGLYRSGECNRYRSREQCARYGVVPLDRLGNIGHSIGRGTSYDLGYIDRFNTTPMWEAWAVEPFFGNHLYGVKLEDVLWFGPEGCTVIS